MSFFRNKENEGEKDNGNKHTEQDQPSSRNDIPDRDEKQAEPDQNSSEVGNTGQGSSSKSTAGNQTNSHEHVMEQSGQRAGDEGKLDDLDRIEKRGIGTLPLRKKTSSEDDETVGKQVDGRSTIQPEAQDISLKVLNKSQKQGDVHDPVTDTQARDAADHGKGPIAHVSSTDALAHGSDVQANETHTEASGSDTKSNDKPTKPDVTPTKPNDTPNHSKDTPHQAKGTPTQPNDTPTKPTNIPTQPNDIPTQASGSSVQADETVIQQGDPNVQSTNPDPLSSECDTHPTDHDAQDMGGAAEGDNATRKEVAKQSCKENGYTEDQIRRAEDSYIKINGHDRYSGGDLAQIIIEEPDDQQLLTEGGTASVYDKGHPADENTPHTIDLHVRCSHCVNRKCQPKINCNVTHE